MGAEHSVKLAEVIGEWQTRLLQLDRRNNLLYFKAGRSAIRIIDTLDLQRRLRNLRRKDKEWEDEPAAVPTARQSKSAVGTLGMSKDGFDAAATEARFETEYDLRRVFDLIDIKVVAHDDFVEVRGAFPKPIEIDLEEMGSVALLRSM